MFIEKFILPSAWEEKDYLISGKNTIGMPTRYDGNVPFGIFPKRQIEKINFATVKVYGNYVIYSFLNENDTKSFYDAIKLQLKNGKKALSF